MNNILSNTAIILVVFLTSCSAQEERGAAIISVCDLAKLPVATSSVSVHLVAKYMTDMRHSALLIDDKCSEVAIQTEADTSQQADISTIAFYNALGKNSLPRRSVEFDVDVSGRYFTQSRPPSDRAPGSGGIFVIDKVWSYSRFPK